MKRRDVFRSLVGCSISAVSPTLLGGCKRPLTREDILAGIIEEVALPDVRAVAEASRRLHVALISLNAGPSAERLATARDAWRNAAASWRQAGAFKQGPLVGTSAVVRASFWPARANTVEQLLAETPTVDAAYVKRLGVDLKGIYGLECFLFPAHQHEAAMLAQVADVGRPRRGQLMEGMAAEIVNLADVVRDNLGSGKELAENFASGGQAQLNQLVSEMIGTLDAVRMKRLESVLAASKAGMLKVADVEGAAGGVSHVLVMREVNTVSRLYSGPANGGVGTLVRAAAPAIDQALTERFAAALSAVRELNAPIEELASTASAKVERARDAIKAVDVALKVDVASALGLTLAFQAGDAD